MIGLPAAGKTTFYCQSLAGTHEHVSEDSCRHNRNGQRRQMMVIAEALAAGCNVAVDNTNPSPEEWRLIIELAHVHNASAVGYWWPPDLPGSLRRNADRIGAARVPDVAVFTTFRRLRLPRPDDGFDRLFEVRFDGRGGFMVAPMEYLVGD